LLSEPIVAPFALETPAPSPRKPPAPTRIVPRLVKVLIVPEFDRPKPPTPTGAEVATPRSPPMILPLFVRLVTAPAFDTPTPPALPVSNPTTPPFPPLMAPLLDSILIVPLLP
jgi:hypothetical protein